MRPTSSAFYTCLYRLCLCMWDVHMSHGHIPQDPEDEKIIEELMKKMTVEEKVGQLELLSRPWGDDFNGESAQWQDTINRTRAGRLGALFNGQGVEVNRALQRVAVEESRLGIPLIFGADVWHGMWTIFPVPLGEAPSLKDVYRCTMASE